MGAAALLLAFVPFLVATDDPLDWIYSCLLPRAASLSLFSVALLFARAAAAAAEEAPCLRKRNLTRFGRKALLITGCSLLFAASCVYRALNIADEGAFLCRGPKSVFNAPAAGRAVATVGEIALVIQIRSYFEDTARRLGMRRPVTRLASLPPAIAAECCSWLGVTSGLSTFFCAEYLLWVAIAAMWAWDAAELLHKSSRRGDTLVHATLVASSLALAAFNLAHELPHFFFATPLNTEAMEPARPTPFACTQDKHSPIWVARLPFFVTYYLGASACSVTLAARYHLCGADASAR